MPAQSSQSINDGQATPVAHVFSPMGVLQAGGEMIASYINRASSVLTGGAERLMHYFRSKKDGALGHRVAIVLPITETVGGIQVVTRVLRSTTTFDIPANSTAQNRKDLRVLTYNALATGTNVAVAVDNGEAVF